MRLTPGELAALKAAAAEAFGPDAVVRLFGSRVDDARRGGDIDLHVEAAPAMTESMYEQRFRVLVWQTLGEPQIDVVVAARGAPRRWIDRAAFREGIVL